MILGEVQMPAKHLQCEECAYDWYSIAKRLPDSCANPKCRSRQWNGVKKKRKPAPKPKITLPKPNRIWTEEIDSVSLNIG